MSGTRGRRARRRGLTLTEVTLVTLFVAMFSMVLGASMLTVTAVNADTWVDNEIINVANRVMDEVVDTLAQAGDFTRVEPVSAPDGRSLHFTHANIAATGGDLIPGVLEVRRRDTAPIWHANHHLRMYFEAEGAPINETLAGRDVNGNGTVTDTNLVAGVLVVERRDAGGNLVPVSRRRIGGGRVRIVRDVVGQVLFSTPGVPGQVVRLAGFPSPPATNDIEDTGVQINLTIAHDPHASMGGGRSLSFVRLSRTVARR